MKSVDARYDRLTPRLALLSDEAVLAQAWKKAERYCRCHNWHADVLALDLEVLTIESDLADWAVAVDDPAYAPAPMELVPAPKNCPWHFPDGESDIPMSAAWSPVDKAQPLRPLAHLKVRDQTLAMALVLCFADAVETLQGPTDQPDAATAREHRVWSYGNRLWCDWQGKEKLTAHARFRWGSTATYSAYFEDYRRFLARPAETARIANGQRRAGRAIHVVELDMTRFFDCIDRERLRRRLIAIWRVYARHFADRDQAVIKREMIDAMRRIMDWRWSDTAEALGHLFDDALPVGLPQGMAASGFLSNAYLLRFDRWMGRRLGRDGDIVIHDYCRYVDDLRLVVEADAGKDADEIGKAVSHQVQGLLDRYCADLAVSHKLMLNTDKTSVIPWADYAVQGSASAQMAWLQGLISATPDQESLRQATAGLDGVLWLSEVMETVDKGPQNPLALSRIARPKLDVRDDTLKRFAAYRLLKAFRMRQSMAVGEAGDDPDALGHLDGASRPALEHEMEATARKLVASWSRNPALAPVLRCALELFPSPVLLDPVLEALALKREPDADVDDRERAVANYVVAELLRAGAVDIGYRHVETIPRGADLVIFRERLARLARGLLREDPPAPWYVRQQAALFLASVLQPDADLVADALLTDYKLLHDALLCRMPAEGYAASAVFAGLVGQQLGADRARFATWVDEILAVELSKDPEQPVAELDLDARLGPRIAEQSVIDLAQAMSQVAPGLFRAVWDAHGDKRRGWTRVLPGYLRPNNQVAGLWRDWSTIGEQSVSLVKVVLRSDNPFRQENATLGLAAALLQVMTDAKDLDECTHWGLLDLEVACDHWENPQRPKARFTIRVNPPGHPDPRNAPPNWCRTELRWAYALGRILRACIVGDPDFTARGFLLREEHARYRGLSSSWFKRRLGLLSSPEGLLGEPSPLSPWLTSFVMQLLQWPGVQVGDHSGVGLHGIETPAQLLRVVEHRQEHQRALYAVQSRMPVYLLPASRGKRDGQPLLRVAMVQTLMPRVSVGSGKSDFDIKNPLYWSPDYRARHRAHLAAVCRLVAQHLETQRSAHVSGNGDSQPDGLDLIVLPELSVHPDDLWLLRSLSDATKANLFVGLTFQESAGGRLVNRALWMLRHEHDGRREIIRVHQGKQHLTKDERDMGIVDARDYQVLVEISAADGKHHRIAGAICYDATDLSLAADLRDKSDCLVIAALNKDVPTFDTMVQALNFHMFQPVVMTNSGQFGGSTAQVPYRERHDKVIAHVHGGGQVAVSIFELDLAAFKTRSRQRATKALKTWPAGFDGRGH